MYYFSKLLIIPPYMDSDLVKEKINEAENHYFILKKLHSTPSFAYLLVKGVDEHGSIKNEEQYSLSY